MFSGCMAVYIRCLHWFYSSCKHKTSWAPRSMGSHDIQLFPPRRTKGWVVPRYLKHSLYVPLWDSMSLILSKFPSCTVSESSLHQYDSILSWITCLSLLIVGLISANKSIAHESIICACYHRWISFSPFLPSTPVSFPATSVSNLKNTMPPHSSILNTYPSNLQAGPITRICHGARSLLLLDRSRGGPGRGARRTWRTRFWIVLGVKLNPQDFHHKSLLSSEQTWPWGLPGTYWGSKFTEASPIHVKAL